MKKLIARLMLTIFSLLLVALPQNLCYAAENLDAIFISEYYAVASFHNGLAAVKPNATAMCGYIDKTGTLVIPLKYEFARDFSEGLACVGMDGKVGYIDTTGNIQIPFDYDYSDMYQALDFSEGLAVVCKNNKYGYINRLGQVVVPIEYDGAYAFHDGLAAVKQKGKIGYIDKTGVLVVSAEYDWFPDPLGSDRSFSEGLAAVCKDGKYGYIDKTGHVAIPFEYDRACVFSDGLARVEKNGQVAYINPYGNIEIAFKDDRWLIYHTEKNFVNGLAITQDEQGLWGFVNKAGAIAIQAEYQITHDFSEGLAVVEKNDKYGYIDRDGNIVIPLEYEFAYSFSDGVAVVEKRGNERGIIKNPIEANDIPTVEDYEVVPVPGANNDISSTIESDVPDNGNFNSNVSPDVDTSSIGSLPSDNATSSESNQPKSVTKVAIPIISVIVIAGGAAIVIKSKKSKR